MSGNDGGADNNYNNNDANNKGEKNDRFCELHPPKEIMQPSTIMTASVIWVKILEMDPLDGVLFY